jgi:hypothetical protein
LDKTTEAEGLEDNVGRIGEVTVVVGGARGGATKTRPFVASEIAMPPRTSVVWAQSGCIVLARSARERRRGIRVLI